MTNKVIAQQRLINQRLTLAKPDNPAELVSWLGAVQAQDYYGAKWALAQRLTHATDESIESAFTNGEILRTHIMRPTWHFVTPADIRWMSKLTASRVHTAMGFYGRKLEFDDALYKRSNKALAVALRGGKQLSREALRKSLDRAGIAADGLRLGFLLARAELDGVICSGARIGKQFTYALLEERVPATRVLERDESIAELTRRYFASHGPATLQDFVWWSGLTVADAKRGLDLAAPGLMNDLYDGVQYWFFEKMPGAKRVARTVQLLPAFDEYLVGYKDRGATFDESHSKQLIQNNVIFESTIVIGGMVAGTWKRTLKKENVIIKLSTFSPLGKLEHSAVDRAVRRYGDFLGLKVAIDR